MIHNCPVTLGIQKFNLFKGVGFGAILSITTQSCKTDCYRIQHAINEICDLVSHPIYVTIGELNANPNETARISNVCPNILYKKIKKQREMHKVCDNYRGNSYLNDHSL